MTPSLVRVDLLLSPYLRRWFVLSPAVTCPCTAFRWGAEGTDVAGGIQPGSGVALKPELKKQRMLCN